MNHPDPHADEHADRFTLLRPLLFTIAYEILGSATEADDVLQDSYLRWATVDLDGVRDTKAYLAQLVTRQALNTLRAEARRREQYVGPWLPEPLLLDDRDASADVVLAESVSMAMLVVLETLSPDERAVFVLREVFGFSHDEIAAAVGKSPAAVRQIRVNCINPGPVDNEFQTGIEVAMSRILGVNVTEELNRTIPLKRHARADEIAGVALFLASDLSTYVTGAVLMVDGGLMS